MPIFQINFRAPYTFAGFTRDVDSVEQGHDILVNHHFIHGYVIANKEIESVTFDGKPVDNFVMVPRAIKQDQEIAFIFNGSLLKAKAEIIENIDSIVVTTVKAEYIGIQLQRQNAVIDDFDECKFDLEVDDLARFEGCAISSINYIGKLAKLTLSYARKIDIISLGDERCNSTI